MADETVSESIAGVLLTLLAIAIAIQLAHGTLLEWLGNKFAQRPRAGVSVSNPFSPAAPASATGKSAVAAVGAGVGGLASGIASGLANGGTSSPPGPAQAPAPHPQAIRRTA